MTTPAPHTMTTDELLRFHGGSPLAPALREALEQLEQAAKALTAARALDEMARNLATAVENDSAMDFLASLPVNLQKLEAARETFEQVDDGELGA